MEYSSFRNKRRGGLLDSAIVEGADYLLDMEIRDPKNRRVMVDYDDSKWDPNYASFMISLEEHWKVKFVEEDEEDPTYVMFLDSLKEYGDAYMLDVSIEHGVYSPIIYEGETSPQDAVRNTPRTRRGKSEIPCQGSHILEKRSLDAKKVANKRDSSILGEKEIAAEDSALKSFWNGLKIVGDSMIYEFGDGERIFYEEELSTDTANGSTVAAIRPIKKTCTQPTTQTFTNQTRSPPLDITPVSTLPPGTLSFAEPNTCATPLTLSSTPMTSSIPPNAHTAPITTVKLLTPSAPAPIAFSVQSTHSSIPPVTSSQPSAPNSRAPTSALGRPAQLSKDSRFWKDLHKYLRKPYDQEEFDGLWKVMNHRSPIQIHRDSRTGGSNREGKMGTSYFEKYPVVNREVEKAQPDSGKVLNLMRMLSYYLQKIPVGRIPEPWLDADTKSILPGSSAT